MARAVTPAVLSARNVSIRRGGRSLLSGLDLEVEAGSEIVVEAEAGLGATTLLKVCAGLVPPDEGTIEVGGVDLHRAPYGKRREAKKKLGFVFQEAALIQNLSLFDNVALPLRYHRVGTAKEVARRVEEVLKTFDLWPMASYGPADLGLQEAHSASLARALAMDPEIILFDDFFTRLSRIRATETWDRVRSTAKPPLTAIVTTTDRSRTPMDRAKVYRFRDGRLENGAAEGKEGSP